MSCVGLSEHDDNQSSVSYKCARGESSISRKPEFHPKQFNVFLFVFLSKHLDFKIYLGKLNNKIFPHTVQC